MKSPIQRSQINGCLIALFCLTSSFFAQAGNDLLPAPPEIQPDIDFWIRVYTEVDTNQGFIHDNQYLNVVYATVQFVPGIDRRERNKKLKVIKEHYRKILLKLARGSKKELSIAEQGVKELWPEGTSKKKFRLAAKRLRFQLGQSDKFKTGLIRSGRWLSHIENALNQQGVPIELTALPHVESSFNPAAYSFIGAAGLWQFTRSTGRRYMRVDHVVDERLDPFVATDAAAKLLKHNFVTTGTWPLAITAYNHGASGMRRAIRQTGGSDVVKILRTYKSRSFKFASRNFYVAFLAAVEVKMNAVKYFGEFEREITDDSKTAIVPAFISAKVIAKKLDIDLDVLKKMNPALRSPVWSAEKLVPKNHALRIPGMSSTEAEVQIASIDRIYQKSRQLPDLTYRVRRGDALSQIADRYRVSVSELMRMNNLRSRHFIRAGQVLRLPKSVVQRSTTIKRELVDGTYRVQRGDTLSTIADAFGSSKNLLVQQNNLKNPHAISVGQIIIVAASELVTVALQVEPIEPTMKDAPALQPIIEQQVSNVEEEPVEVEVVGETEMAGPVTSETSLLSADPSNYSVNKNNIAIVQAGETLGHFAEWLEVKASDLRKTNRLKFGQSLIINGRLKLDFSRVDRAKFEEIRIAYHRNIQEAYFSQYRILGVEERKIRRGDSIWELTHFVYKVPLWLFMQYNPDLNISNVSPGKKVLFPKVEEKPMS